MLLNKCISIDFTILMHYNYALKGGVDMAFSYKPLWKLLIDKEMNKKGLMEVTGISKSTMDKMGRGENVSLEIIDRICKQFSCKIEDVVQFYEPGIEEKHEE